MPYYDFKCNDCDLVVETTDSNPPDCTSCKKIMIRIWSSTPVHFKGSGFYSTGG